MPDGLYSKSQACQAYIVWLGLKEKPGTGIQASWSNKPTHPVSLVITSPPDRLALLSLPIQNTLFRPGLLAHTFNPSTWEAEAGGFPSSKPAWSTEWVPGQPGLHRETLSRKKKKKKEYIILSSDFLLANPSKGMTYNYLLSQIIYYHLKLYLVHFLYYMASMLELPW